MEIQRLRDCVATALRALNPVISNREARPQQAVVHMACLLYFSKQTLIVISLIDHATAATPDLEILYAYAPPAQSHVPTTSHTDLGSRHWRGAIAH